MLTGLLQDRAALYVSGDMAEAERENYEVILEFHAGLRAEVAGLQEVVATLAMTPVVPLAPPAALKGRLLAALDALRPAVPEGWVATGPGGLIEWVNPAFTAMCGYTLEELRGRKPGPLLQGPDTDPAAIARIREAIRERRACRETLMNYHKNGTRYRVAVRISPVLDDEGQPLWFVAREQMLAENGRNHAG